jgi:hypothetical protein
MESLALSQDDHVQRPEKNRAGGGGVKLTRRPGADLVSMVRQSSLGQPSAAWGSLHRSGSGGMRSNHLGCFDSRQLGHQPNQPHSFTMTTAEGRSQHQEKAGDEPSSAASAGRVPERDPASDLLVMETAGKSARQRQERVERGAFCPRWRWWNSPETTRIARRWRRRFRVHRRGSQGARGERPRQV